MFAGYTFSLTQQKNNSIVTQWMKNLVITDTAATLKTIHLITSLSLLTVAKFSVRRSPLKLAAENKRILRSRDRKFRHCSMTSADGTSKYETPWWRLHYRRLIPTAQPTAVAPSSSLEIAPRGPTLSLSSLSSSTAMVVRNIHGKSPRCLQKFCRISCNPSCR